MDLGKLLDALKGAERSILISLGICFPLIYTLLFYTLDEFKTYEWYQQILISAGIDISYILGVAGIINLLYRMTYQFTRQEANEDFIDVISIKVIPFYVLISSITPSLYSLITTGVFKPIDIYYTIAGLSGCIIVPTIVLIWVNLINNKHNKKKK